jgi:hypothetical protein
MNRRVVRIVVIALLGFSSLVWYQTPGARSAEPRFTGAAMELSRTGKVGGYGLGEPPGYYGARCRYDATGNGGDGSVTLGYLTKPTVSAHTDYDTQNVSVTTKVYQVLADGTLQFVTSPGGIGKIVGPDPTPMSAISASVPAGPTYVLGYTISWWNQAISAVEGTVEVIYTSYRPSILDPVQIFPYESVCEPVWPPYTVVSSTSGTVNTTLNYTVHRYPLNVTVQARWDGTSIDTVHTDSTAKGSDSLKIPAAPQGAHTLSFTYSTWSSSVTYTIKPRIKLIPDTVARGSTVDVSLRGFAAHESVEIRWKKGSSWVHVGQVTTSSTGSANVDVNVPTWAADGLNSVRGDGATSAAQTNAVTVSGGPMSASAAKTPTPTATATPLPTATSTPTITPTLVPSTPTPTPAATDPPAASPVASS